MAKRQAPEETAPVGDLTKEEKLKRLDKARLELEKKHGKGTTFMGNERPDVPMVCSYGSMKLDLAVGGGVPRGRIIEVYGPESSGKTTLCLHAIADCQKNDGIAAFIDAEHALDPSWARKLNVDMNELLVSQPDCGEQALQIVQDLIESGGVDLVVVDSVAALVPRAEINGEIGDANIALQARLMSQAMRILTAVISKSKATVIFINQTRDKIGVMYGNPETTTGGNALKFYASQRIRISRITGDSKVDDVLGQTVSGIKCKVVKNKIAPPFKVCSLELDTGRDGNYGFNVMAEIMDLAISSEIITRAGAWYMYNGERFQGGGNVLKALQANEDM